MSDYTKLTNYAVKDGYTSGTPAKVIKGTELDDEFNAISTAIATKVDSTDVIPVATGGTGSTTAADARTALSAAKSGANSDITSLTGLTTALSVAQGGTGATILTANNVLLGNGTSAPQAVAPGTSGNVLTSNGTTWVSQAGVTSVNGSTGAVTVLQLGVGQTWQNVTGSRSANTTYQNTTNKPICFTVYPTGYTGGELQVSTDGSTWVAVMRTTDFSGASNSGFAIVPPNQYYRYTNSFNYWAELR